MVIRSLYFFTLVVGLFSFSCDSEYKGERTIEDVLKVPSDLNIQYVIEYEKDLSRHKVKLRQTTISVPLGLTEEDLKNNINHAILVTYKKYKPDGIYIRVDEKVEGEERGWGVARVDFAPNGEWINVRPNVPLNKFGTNFEIHDWYLHPEGKGMSQRIKEDYKKNGKETTNEKGKETTRQTFLSEGVDYASQGKFIQAKERFERALEFEPFSRKAKNNLKIIKDVIEQKIKREAAILLFKGASYAGEDQYDQAISYGTKAIKLYPKLGYAYNLRGTSYGHEGEWDLAIIDFNKALEINPEDQVALYNRGHAYNLKGQYDQAISDFNLAIEIELNYDYAYYNRAFSYNKKGQHDQAISDLNMALEINPEFAEAYDSRGVTYFDILGDKVKGCADLQRACALGKCDNYLIAIGKGYCP